MENILLFPYFKYLFFKKEKKMNEKEEIKLGSLNVLASK